MTSPRHSTTLTTAVTTAFAAMLLATLTSATAIAADEAPKDPKLAELETQLAIEKARNDLLAARFPTIEGGKAGTLAAGEGALYPLGAWSQVYERLSSAASEICDNAKTLVAGKGSLTLVSDGQLGDVVAYRLASIEFATLTAAYEGLKGTLGKKGEKSALGVAAAVIPSLVSFAKLFRTDRTLHQEEVEVPNPLLLDLVRSQCKKKQVEVRRPLDKGALAVLALNQSRLWSDLVKQLATKTEVMQWAASAKEDAVFNAAATAYLARLDAFVSGLTAKPEGKGEPPLVQALHGEAIVGALESGGNRLLVVDILKQGGSSMITSNFWREDRLYVSGGAIVAWRIVDGSESVASDVIRKVDLRFVRVSLE